VTKLHDLAVDVQTAGYSVAMELSTVVKIVMMEIVLRMPRAQQLADGLTHGRESAEI